VWDKFIVMLKGVGPQRLQMEASSSGIGKGMGMSVKIGMEYGRVVNNSKIIDQAMFDS